MTPHSPRLRASLRSGALELGNTHACGSHDVQHQERKAEAVKTAIELVDEGLLGHVHVIPLEPAAQLFVRQVFVLTQIEHQLLGVIEVNLLVGRTQGHRIPQIVYELAASYRRLNSTAPNNPFTSCSVDALVEKPEATF